MAEREASPDGSFKLFYRKGWAYLVVSPPEKNGRPVYPEQIENRMKMLRIPAVRSRVIREIIERASGRPEALVEWPAGRALAARVSLVISEDSMSATVTVVGPKKGAAPPSVDDILEELNHSGVLFGIDRKRIEKLLGDREYEKPIRVAAGQEPVFGRAAHIVYHFNTNRGKPYLEMDFGRINLRELNFIENVRRGDLLAELEPPTEPVDGWDIRGQILPAQMDGQAVELRAGQNTRLSSDRTRIFAETDGNVRIDRGTVLVEPVVIVKNVNYETGNIHFEGSVVVSGSIADGFVVEADGDIQVGRGVGRATLKAGGSILLKTGVNGNGEASIDCGGDLFAKYIESSTVTCRGNVIVEEAIMHSRLTTFKHCVLNGRRSEVIASELIVGGSFWCKKLGNIYESPTSVSIGIEPNLLLTFRSTERNWEAKRAELDKIEEQLEQFERLIREKRADERVLRARSQLQGSASTLRGEMAELRRRMPNLRERLLAARRSMAVVEEMVYKGATLTFGTLEYRAPDAGVRKTVFRAVGGSIVESGFNYHDRPKLTFDMPDTIPSPSA